MNKAQRQEIEEELDKLQAVVDDKEATPEKVRSQARSTVVSIAVILGRSTEYIGNILWAIQKM